MCVCACRLAGSFEEAVDGGEAGLGIGWMAVSIGMSDAEPDLDAADAGPAACGAPHDNDDLGDYGHPGHGYRVGLGEFDQTAELASAEGTGFLGGPAEVPLV